MLGLAGSIIVVAALMRPFVVTEHFDLATAVAVFAGWHIPNVRWAVVLTLFALFVSDLTLGLHSVLPVMYLTFASMIYVASVLRRTQNIWVIAIALVAGSALFFLLTNFGIWILGGCSWTEGPAYPLTMASFLLTYERAFPYFLSAIVGDILLGVVLFGSFTVLQRLTGTRLLLTFAELKQ